MCGVHIYIYLPVFFLFPACGRRRWCVVLEHDSYTTVHDTQHTRNILQECLLCVVHVLVNIYYLVHLLMAQALIEPDSCSWLATHGRRVEYTRARSISTLHSMYHVWFGDKR